MAVLQCIPPLCELLTVQDSKIVSVALHAIENILKLDKPNGVVEVQREKARRGPRASAPPCVIACRRMLLFSRWTARMMTAGRRLKQLRRHPFSW